MARAAKEEWEQSQLAQGDVQEAAEGSISSSVGGQRNIAFSRGKKANELCPPQCCHVSSLWPRTLTIRVCIRLPFSDNQLTCTTSSYNKTNGDI